VARTLEDWSVVSQLDGVAESKEPEFGGKEMFCHVVSGRVACAAPVDFTEAILAMSTARSTTNLSVFHDLFYFFADKFEVAISDHLCWELASLTQKFSQLVLDCGSVEVLETEYEFHSSLSINNKECIVDLANGTAVAIADVVVEDIAKGLWVTDGLCVVASFRKSGCFTARENRVSICVTDADVVLCERLEMFEDGVDVTKTKALLKEFSSDDFCFQFC